MTARYKFEVSGASFVNDVVICKRRVSESKRPCSSALVGGRRTH